VPKADSVVSPIVSTGAADSAFAVAPNAGTIAKSILNANTNARNLFIVYTLHHFTSGI